MQPIPMKLVDIRQLGPLLFMLDTHGDLWLFSTKLASGVSRIIGVEGRPWYITYESNGVLYALHQLLKEPIAVKRASSLMRECITHP
jgi:hypothetical protein